MGLKNLFGIAIISSLSLSSITFAKDVIHTFRVNDNTYEVYVGYGQSVYVTHTGSTDSSYVTDTSYVKSSGYGCCNWKLYGNCVSYSKMISDIEYRVSANKY